VCHDSPEIIWQICITAGNLAGSLRGALGPAHAGPRLPAPLVRHLADFLPELGDDFSFVGRQRRLRLDDSCFRVDLLFSHRRLKCLLLIDLKAGRFSHADAGQMHMVLHYAREHWMKPGDNPPAGLILCTGKGAAEARYALDSLGNTVLAADYRTVLPDSCRRGRLRRAAPSAPFRARCHQGNAHRRTETNRTYV